jgi:predicted transcriptional regulator
MLYMSDSKNVNVVVTYGETTVEFKGTPETVMESVLRFLAKQVPQLDLAKKISLNYPASELIEMYSDYIKITPEGPRVIAEGKKLSDKDLIALQLVAYKVANELGRADGNGISPQELQTSTALNPKSVSSRLSELVKSGHVDKDSTDQGVKYRITTQGIHWLSSTLLKRAKP